MDVQRSGGHKGTATVRIVALAACSVALIGLVIYNNRALPQADESETSGSDPAVMERPEPVRKAAVQTAAPSSPVNDAPAAVPAAVARGGDTDAPRAAVTPAAVKREQPGTAPAVALRKMVEIGHVVCRTVDRDDIRIVFGMRLMYEPDALREEILEKREPIKLLVQKTIAPKSQADLVVEPLRMELAGVINSVLAGGRLADLELTDFRIEKVER